MAALCSSPAGSASLSVHVCVSRSFSSTRCRRVADAPVRIRFRIRCTCAAPWSLLAFAPPGRWYTDLHSIRRLHSWGARAAIPHAHAGMAAAGCILSARVAGSGAHACVAAGGWSLSVREASVARAHLHGSRRLYPCSVPAWLALAHTCSRLRHSSSQPACSPRRLLACLLATVCVHVCVSRAFGSMRCRRVADAPVRIARLTRAAFGAR